MIPSGTRTMGVAGGLDGVRTCPRIFFQNFWERLWLEPKPYDFWSRAPTTELSMATKNLGRIPTYAIICS